MQTLTKGQRVKIVPNRFTRIWEGQCGEILTVSADGLIGECKFDHGGQMIVHVEMCIEEPITPIGIHLTKKGA